MAKEIKGYFRYDGRNVKFIFNKGSYENFITFLEIFNVSFLSEMAIDFSIIPSQLHGKGNSVNLLDYLANNTDNNELILKFLEYFITFIIDIRYISNGDKINYEIIDNISWQNMTFIVGEPIFITTTTTTLSPLNTLTITYINMTDVPVNDVNLLSDWNTYFDLPTYGSPFYLVEVSGTTVTLFNAGSITLKNNIFGDFTNYLITYNLLKVEDTGCVIACRDGIFLNLIYGGCYYLTTVHFPNCISLGNDVFHGCSNLSDLVLPFNSYTSLGDSVFQGCNLLSGVLTFNNVTSAGNYCFDSCYLLTQINIPNLLTAGDSCFSKTVGVTNFNYPVLLSAGTWCFSQYASAMSSLLLTINLPEVLYIGDYCYYGDVSLNTIYMPKLINLGSTVLDNSVFTYLEGNSGSTLTLTIPLALMTCNDGVTTFDPDGDIGHLQSTYSGTLNIITTT